MKIPHLNLLLSLSVIFLTVNTFSQNFERIEHLSNLQAVEKNSGVSVADYDGDFDLDLFIVAKAKDNPEDPSTLSRLYRNNNDGSFTDVTEQAGLLNLIPTNIEDDDFIGLDGFKYGVFWGDFNNDGFPDLFFTHISGIQLFVNNTDGTFSDITQSSGIFVEDSCNNTGATWFDFNKDGWLDIYINDWGGCRGNSLFQNNGDGTFKKIETPSPPKSDGNSRQSYTMLPFDFNNDGWLDMYVTNDFHEPNSLFINQNGTSFIEQASEYGVDNKFDDMGVAFGDFDNDGDFDLFLTGINENALLENDGTNHFSTIESSNGINETGWGWGAHFADFDNDLDEDLIIMNGFSSLITRNLYFSNLWNLDQKEFENQTHTANIIEPTKSVESVPFDYDNDGDLDLFVSNLDRKSYLYQNNTENKNWVKISLVGTTSNRDGFGSVVSLLTKKDISLKRNYSGSGFLSQSIQPVHFGLDNENSIKKVTVKWPSGLEETFHDLNSNQWYKITEGQGIEKLNTNTSNKIYGCTDPNSCTYNPEATASDNSCEYSEINGINGQTLTAFGNVETYTVQLNQGSSPVWSVEGGEIIEGKDTNTIKVRWGFYKEGSVSVFETNASCNSKKTTLFVQLHLNRITNNYSIARLWNEALLEAIRNDFARPNVHARNLFHTSVAMYDSWALHKNTKTYLIGNTDNNPNASFTSFESNEDINQSIQKTISYAMYRLLNHRFKNSPGSEESLYRFQFIMNQLGYDTDYTESNYTEGNPAALGNFIAETIINYGLQDGSREEFDYEYEYYSPINQPLDLALSGIDKDNLNPNRWQPLTFDTFIDQSGNLIEGSTPRFLGPEWGNVLPFALKESDKTTFFRDQNPFYVYHDPGAPPHLNITEDSSISNSYKWNFSLVSIWSAHLDPNDGVFMDISPASLGNIDIDSYPTNFVNYNQFYNEVEGGDTSVGHSVNPKTNTPYEPQIIPRGDYTRVLAEFWADGPDSETPPGHWFTILNHVNDHPELIKKLNGSGEILSNLEWDIKSYFVLGGTMHDAAISAWSIKGWYDYIRPISAIRYMAALGQSTDASLDNYHVGGIPLKQNYIEIVSDKDPLKGQNNQHVGKIKVKAWKGHDYISDATTDTAGVDWILAENWWPYQRPSFVTPPFAGYVSGHSTFSRAAAEVLTLLTGDEYFPGGMGEFLAKKDEFLVFEKGPSVDVKLQWATYRDASDQTSLSRIWGGIHPPADDLLGRKIGETVGINAFQHAKTYFESNSTQEPTENIELIAYPNPVVDNLLHISNIPQIDTIALFNVIGKEIKINNQGLQTNNSKLTIKLPNHLPSGVYILSLNNKKMKIIIQK